MSPVRALTAIAGALLCVGLVVLSVAQLVAPQRDGLLALGQILAPYLFLLVVPFLLLILTRGLPGRLLRWGMLAAIMVFVVRFAPGWVSLPGATPATAATRSSLVVATWNLELGQPDPAVVVETIRAMDADVIGLVELTPRHAAAIAADPELAARFRTIELRPTEGSLGIGILSTLDSAGRPRGSSDPPMMVQRLVAADGQVITVVAAHPLPGTIEAAGDTIPIGYDATSRDRHLARVREVVAPILAAGEPLLLIGDFNVVDREPGYGDLAAGLIDAHRAAGLGPGHTWRPGRLEWLPFGLLRIDYLFSANGPTPLSIAPDCTPRGSDHCIVIGRMALP